MKDRNKRTADPYFTDIERAFYAHELLKIKTASLSVTLDDASFLTQGQIKKLNKELKSLSVDEYIQKTIEQIEQKKRNSAKTVIDKMSGRVIKRYDQGSLYAVEKEIHYKGRIRRVGIIAQNKDVNNGVWSPKHHRQAQDIAREFCDHSIPIVTFIDTPGADASSSANLGNQAHSISHLIAEMCDVPVPTVGIVYGLGYSGGAIPLAATNVLLGIKNSSFNTIQPKGLANIARQYDLSWQECAKYVGLSPTELYNKKILDGVINWSSDKDDSSFLVNAFMSAIEGIEAAAAKYVAKTPAFFDFYRRGIMRYIEPSRALQKLKKISRIPLSNNYTKYQNIFGLAYSHLRFMNMTKRISFGRLDSYGRLAGEEIKTGDLSQRTQIQQENNFARWFEREDLIVYNQLLLSSWKQFLQRREEVDVERNKISAMLLGDPQKKYEEVLYRLCFSLGFYLYNLWKLNAPINFQRLLKLIKQKKVKSNLNVFNKTLNTITVLDILELSEVRSNLVDVFSCMVVFDKLYGALIDNFKSIAEECKSSMVMSKQFVKKLLGSSLKTQGDVSSEKFSKWLTTMTKFKQTSALLKDTEEWKRVSYPRLSDAMLVLITFFFDRILQSYLQDQQQGKPYDGKINPVHIGKRKDFWNQLDIAYKDVLVQGVLQSCKKQKKTTYPVFQKTFFQGFQELDADLMTSNPVNFPGFRFSIEKALKNNITPCGLITGIAKLKFGKNQKVGVAISNTAFQAGAFDMASGQKLCNLLVECSILAIPAICFVSSGGMQTKEGPSSLFSMSLVNDRITRFIRDNDLPVIVFGFGDCTGGSQASFVTHPLVQTYYFSGADLPFAGRVVVPSYLPAQATVANYLSKNEGVMRGMVKNPFFPDLDEQLRAIDSEIDVPTETVEQVIARVLSGVYLPEMVEINKAPLSFIDLMSPIKKVLIHARGCTAVKLIRIAQKRKIQVVLVASDPDMDSVPAKMLDKNDILVCLGGQTSDESYLNSASVFNIASREKVDALHPGIGFLSENHEFALQCRKDHQLNFIGPLAKSMQIMGNKSNAISTAISSKVPVVPGSRGILTSIEATKKVAEEIGYPVLLKAVHGGGGRGIKVVESENNVQEAFNMVQSEALAAFGNGDLYLEKYITSMRHIEVQVLRDAKGNTKILGLRDCSVQRNNQKVFEESGSTVLSTVLANRAYKYAKQLADAVDYMGAGTVEFIYDLKDKAIYFMEMNTRLQVEHPVTEATSGVSIVNEQFNIAENKSIKNLKITEKGYAIEARITAESVKFDDNLQLTFTPSPGKIVESVIPEKDYLESIAITEKNIVIPSFYDSLIAQLICYGTDRNDAIKKLLTVLEQTKIKGICTNIPLLKKILVDKTFIEGVFDTTYLPKFLNSCNQKQLVKEMADNGVKQSDKDLLASIIIPDSTQLKVLSPITGVYYNSPSPTEPPYVEEGDIIDLGAVFCQLEAMKTFSVTSLKSLNSNTQLYKENQYRVARISVSDVSQVNAGDLLLVVEPV